VLKKFGISMMIITKSYSFPSDHILNILAQCDTEIRVSISALDSSQELKKRVRLLAKYKTVGGKSIPYLMSSRYSDLQLISNQIALTKWIEENDMIAAEHPLRISSDNKIISLLAGDGFWHPKFINQYWFGRLYENHSNFMLPPPTYLLPEYHLRYRSASEAQGKIIVGLDGNLPTFSSLQAGKVEVNNNLFKHASYGIKEK